MTWGRSNPNIFTTPIAGMNYDRFGQGQVGTTIGNRQQTGTASIPEAKFDIPPGNPIPAAWAANTGNLLGPGGKTNQAPPTPKGVTSEQQYAANTG